MGDEERVDPTFVRGLTLSEHYAGIALQALLTQADLASTDPLATCIKAKAIGKIMEGVMRDGNTAP